MSEKSPRKRFTKRRSFVPKKYEDISSSSTYTSNQDLLFLKQPPKKLKPKELPRTAPSLFKSVLKSTRGVGKSMNPSSGLHATPYEVLKCQQRELPKLLTSSIRLFDGTNPTQASPRPGISAVNDNRMPSTNPPDLTKATSMGGIVDYKTQCMKNNYSAELPPEVKSNTVLRRVREKIDHHGDAGRRGSESAIGAHRRQTKRDFNIRQIKQLMRVKKGSDHLLNEKNFKLMHRTPPEKPKKDDYMKNYGPTKPRNEDMLRSLSDNVITRITDIEKADLKAGKGALKSGDAGKRAWPFTSRSLHKSAGRANELEYKSALNKKLKVSESLAKLIKDKTKDETGSTRPYITTVGAPVEIDEPLVMVGKLMRPDGTFKKVVILGDLRGAPVVQRNASVDTMMTLPPSMVDVKAPSNFGRPTNKPGKFGKVTEPPISETVEASGELTPPSKLPRHVPFGKVLEIVRSRIINESKTRIQEYIKEKKVGGLFAKFNFGGKVGPEEDLTTLKSIITFDEADKSISQVDLTSVLVIGNERHGVSRMPDSGVKFDKANPNFLRTIPKPEEGVFRSKIKLGKKMRTIRKEIAKTTNLNVRNWRKLTMPSSETHIYEVVEDNVVEAVAQNMENSFMESTTEQEITESEEVTSLEDTEDYGIEEVQEEEVMASVVDQYSECTEIEEYSEEVTTVVVSDEYQSGDAVTLSNKTYNYSSYGDSVPMASGDARLYANNTVPFPSAGAVYSTKRSKNIEDSDKKSLLSQNNLICIGKVRQHRLPKDMDTMSTDEINIQGYQVNRYSSLPTLSSTMRKITNNMFSLISPSNDGFLSRPSRYRSRRKGFVNDERRSYELLQIKKSLSLIAQKTCNVIDSSYMKTANAIRTRNSSKGFIQIGKRNRQHQFVPSIRTGPQSTESYSSVETYENEEGEENESGANTSESKTSLDDYSEYDLQEQVAEELQAENPYDPVATDEYDEVPNDPTTRHIELENESDANTSESETSLDDYSEYDLQEQVAEELQAENPYDHVATNEYDEVPNDPTTSHIKLDDKKNTGSGSMWSGTDLTPTSQNINKSKTNKGSGAVPAVNSKELIGFPGSMKTSASGTEVDSRGNPKLSEKDYTNKFYSAASSLSVHEVVKFFESQRSLKEHIHERKGRNQGQPAESLYGILGQNNVKPKPRNSLGTSQSLNSLSSMTEDLQYFEKEIKRKKQNRFPKGLLKSGAWDYSSTNVSMVTTWWDESSGGDVKRLNSCDESMPPRLNSEEDEIRNRSAVIPVDKSDCFKTHAAMTYLRGDGLLFKTCDKKTSGTKLRPEKMFKYGQGMVHLKMYPKDCAKVCEKLTKTKQDCQDPKCIFFNCEEKMCDRKPTVYNRDICCEEEISDSDPDVTLKYVTKILKRGKKSKGNGNDHRWTSPCQRCPEHDNRFQPFFPDLFEQRGITPLAKRIVDFAWWEGKNLYRQMYPDYTEDAIEQISDEFSFFNLEQGVSRFLVEDAINFSWAELQSERTFEIMVDEEIRDHVNKMLIGEFSQRYIDQGRRTLIIEDYLAKNTPKKGPCNMCACENFPVTSKSRTHRIIEKYTRRGLIPNDQITREVRALMKDVTAAVVLCEELDLNAPTSKSGAQLGYGLAQIFGSQKTHDTTRCDFSPECTDDVETTVYKMVKAVGQASEIPQPDEEEITEVEVELEEGERSNSENSFTDNTTESSSETEGSESDATTPEETSDGSSTQVNETSNNSSTNEETSSSNNESTQSHSSEASENSDENIDTPQVSSRIAENGILKHKETDFKIIKRRFGKRITRLLKKFSSTDYSKTDGSKKGVSFNDDQLEQWKSESSAATISTSEYSMLSQSSSNKSNYSSTSLLSSDSTNSDESNSVSHETPFPSTGIKRPRDNLIGKSKVFGSAPNFMLKQFGNIAKNRGGNEPANFSAPFPSGMPNDNPDSDSDYVRIIYTPTTTPRLPEGLLESQHSGLNLISTTYFSEEDGNETKPLHKKGASDEIARERTVEEMPPMPSCGPKQRKNKEGKIKSSLAEKNCEIEYESNSIYSSIYTLKLDQPSEQALGFVDIGAKSRTSMKKQKSENGNDNIYAKESFKSPRTVTIGKRIERKLNARGITKTRPTVEMESDTLRHLYVGDNENNLVINNKISEHYDVPQPIDQQADELERKSLQTKLLDHDYSEIDPQKYNSHNSTESTANVSIASRNTKKANQRIDKDAKKTNQRMNEELTTSDVNHNVVKRSDDLPKDIQSGPRLSADIYPKSPRRHTRLVRLDESVAVTEKQVNEKLMLSEKSVEPKLASEIYPKSPRRNSEEFTKRRNVSPQSKRKSSNYSNETSESLTSPRKSSQIQQTKRSSIYSDVGNEMPLPIRQSSGPRIAAKIYPKSPRRHIDSTETVLPEYDSISKQNTSKPCENEYEEYMTKNVTCPSNYEQLLPNPALVINQNNQQINVGVSQNSFKYQPGSSTVSSNLNSEYKTYGVEDLVKDLNYEIEGLKSLVKSGTAIPDNHTTKSTELLTGKLNDLENSFFDFMKEMKNKPSNPISLSQNTPRNKATSNESTEISGNKPILPITQSQIKVAKNNLVKPSPRSFQKSKGKFKSHANFKNYIPKSHKIKKTTCQTEETSTDTVCDSKSVRKNGRKLFRLRKKRQTSKMKPNQKVSRSSYHKHMYSKVYDSTTSSSLGTDRERSERSMKRNYRRYKNEFKVMHPSGMPAFQEEEANYDSPMLELTTSSSSSSSSSGDTIQDFYREHLQRRNILNDSQRCTSTENTGSDYLRIPESSTFPKLDNCKDDVKRKSDTRTKIMNNIDEIVTLKKVGKSKDLLHGGIKVSTRNLKIPSVHIKTRQKDESIQLNVPTLLKYYEDIQKKKKTHIGGNVTSAKISDSSSEEAKTDNEVEMTRTRTIEIEPQILIPSTGKTVILVNRSNRTPEKSSEESLLQEDKHIPLENKIIPTRQQALNEEPKFLDSLKPMRDKLASMNQPNEDQRLQPNKLQRGGINFGARNLKPIVRFNQNKYGPMEPRSQPFLSNPRKDLDSSSSQEIIESPWNSYPKMQNRYPDTRGEKSSQKEVTFGKSRNPRWRMASDSSDNFTVDSSRKDFLPNRNRFHSDRKSDDRMLDSTAKERNSLNMIDFLRGLGPTRQVRKMPKMTNQKISPNADYIRRQDHRGLLIRDTGNSKYRTLAADSRNSWNLSGPFTSLHKISRDSFSHFKSMWPSPSSESLSSRLSRTSVLTVTSAVTSLTYKTLLTVADNGIRFLIIAAILYYFLQEEIFKFDTRPPI